MMVPTKKHHAAVAKQRFGGFLSRLFLPRMKAKLRQWDACVEFENATSIAAAKLPIWISGEKMIATEQFCGRAQAVLALA